MRKCCKIPINAEIKIIGHNTPRKIKASPWLLMPPKTKSEPCAAKASRMAKKSATCLITPSPLAECRKK
ncbi:hypothetical protein D3C86_2151950 [compost metagenome]